MLGDPPWGTGDTVGSCIPGGGGRIGLCEDDGRDSDCCS